MNYLRAVWNWMLLMLTPPYSRETEVLERMKYLDRQIAALTVRVESLRSAVNAVRSGTSSTAGLITELANTPSVYKYAVRYTGTATRKRAKKKSGNRRKSR